MNTDNIKSVISDLEAIATNMTGDLTPANVANIALAKLTHPTPSNSATEGGESTLTEGELWGLKEFSEGRDIPWTLQKELRKKGHLRAVDIADNEVTDAGKRVLAAQPQAAEVTASGADEQPSHITALQFDIDQFVDLIAANKCEVWYLGQRVRALSRRAEDGNYMIWPLNDSEISGFIDPQDKMSVTWLPVPQQPVPATAEGESQS